MRRDLSSVISALPEQAGLVDIRSGEQLTARQLQERAADKGRLLARNGLRAGSLVAVAAPNPVEYLTALLACWIEGVIAVAVNPQISEDERSNIVDATGASAWFGADDLERCGPTHDIAATDTAQFDAPALILMTSGTTGKPKGIVHSRRSVMARIALNISHIGRKTFPQVLCPLPVFFGHGLIGNILTPLFAGGRVHLWPAPSLQEMRSLGKILDDREISFMSSVPSMWKIALRMSDRPEKKVSRVHVGSAPLATGLWRDIAEWCGTRNVFNMFGMTETANWIGGGSLDDAAGRDGFVGLPWGGQIAVLDDEGKIGFSGKGEVLVQTPSIMQGYWKRPDLQEMSFVGEWFRTGDIGEIEPGSGGLVLVGRLKSEINRGGIKIQAEEVDMLLERHGDIVEACAFGIPDPVAGEVVAAAVVLRPGARFNADEIRKWCLAHARPDAVPARIDAVDSIPRNDRGKVVRADVRKLLTGHES